MKNKAAFAFCFFCMALVICFRLFRWDENEKANASPLINTHSETASVQTSVYYDAPGFLVVYPPGSVVQVGHTEDTPPLVWTYYEGTTPNDAHYVVSYLDIPVQLTLTTPDAQIDSSLNNMFVPGYSIKKEAGRLDTLPAVYAVVSGFGQGSDTVQCHKCRRDEAHMVVAWSKKQRRLWMLMTLTDPNKLSSEKAVKFLNSFKLK